MDDDDLGFLDDVEAFVESLGSYYSAICFTASEPDYQVLEVNGVGDVETFGMAYFDDCRRIMVLTVPANRDRVEVDGVDFYRFYLHQCHLRTPINLHLQSWIEKVGLERVPNRCDKAVVVALKGTCFNAQLTSIPPQYQMSTVGQVRVSTEMDIETYYPKNAIVDLTSKSPDFQIPTACQECFVSKRKCNKVYPCSSCEANGLCCKPATGWTSTNMRKLLSKWIKAGFHANLSFKYFVYMESCNVKCRTGLRNLDISGMFVSLDAMYKLDSCGPIPEPMITKAPFKLLNFIGTNKLFKMEWYYREAMTLYHSEGYCAEFGEAPKQLEVAKEEKIPIMFADFHGADDPYLATHMNIECFENPEFPIVHHGKLVWKTEDKPVYSTIRKMGVKYDCYHYIVATVVIRGYYSQMGEIVSVV